MDDGGDVFVACHIHKGSEKIVGFLIDNLNNKIEKSYIRPPLKEGFPY